MRLETVFCNLCGSSDQQQRFRKKGHLTEETFTIVQCRSCGLMFVNPRLSEEKIQSLYDKDYFSGEGFDPFVALEEESQKITWAARALDRIAAVKHPPVDLLEVGPGRGHFLGMAGERGFRAVGLELSDYAAQRLRQDGLQVLQGTIDRAGIPDQSYDVVVAVEVIEHLTDPRSFFVEVARILRPDGLFYYETGDIDCEQARAQGVDWDYIRPEGHLYYFSPRTLARYLTECGFSVRYPMWFNPTRRIARIIGHLGLIHPERALFEGMGGALGRRVLAAWDWLPSRRPYPMAVRRQ